jgi:hypothetical protein
MDQASVQMNQKLKQLVLEIEKEVSKLVSERITIKGIGIPSLEDEIMLSVAALFSGRVCSYVEVLSGEPKAKVRERFMNSFEYSYSRCREKILADYQKHLAKSDGQPD